MKTLVELVSLLQQQAYQKSNKLFTHFKGKQILHLFAFILLQCNLLTQKMQYVILKKIPFTGEK